MNSAGKITQADSPMVRRLDHVRLSEADRAMAKEHMRQAERAIDLIAVVVQRIRSATSRWTDRLLPSANREREAYLSAAVDRVDLERRIRALERRPNTFLGSV